MAICLPISPKWCGKAHRRRRPVTERANWAKSEANRETFQATRTLNAAANSPWPEGESPWPVGVVATLVVVAMHTVSVVQQERAAPVSLGN